MLEPEPEPVEPDPVEPEPVEPEPVEPEPVEPDPEPASVPELEPFVPELASVPEPVVPELASVPEPLEPELDSLEPEPELPERILDEPERCERCDLVDRDELPEPLPDPLLPLLIVPELLL